MTTTMTRLALTRVALPVMVAVFATAGLACGDGAPGDSPLVKRDSSPTATVPADCSFEFVIPDPGPLDPSVYNVPQLTADQLTEAGLIAEADPLLCQIVERSLYSIGSVGPWLEDDVLVGVVVEVVLETPQTVEADWPYLQRDENGTLLREADGSKARRQDHHTVNDLRVFQLLIDLEEGHVAAFGEYDYASVTTPTP